MPPSKPEAAWANRTVRDMHEAFPSYKWRNGEEDQFANLLIALPRDRDHAIAAVDWLLKPVEDFRGQVAQRRFAGVQSLREAVTATGPDRSLAATFDARDAVLRAFPHDLLALEAVPATDGHPCPTCCSRDRWDRWGVRADDPLRRHMHPLWTVCRENWPDPDLVALYGGPLPWNLAFAWAATHSPSGDPVERYHPVGSRIGFALFAQREREYLESPAAVAQSAHSRAALDAILKGFGAERRLEPVRVARPVVVGEPLHADVLGLE